MSLIRNEQTKLTATFLNGLGVAVFAVGAFAPLVSGLLSGGGPSWFTLALAILCVLAAGGLHWMGRAILRGLQP